MSEPLNIRKIMEELIAGRMRVPNFQRGFVWDPERVAYLMDSIYKGYPFGSILLWRTRQELAHERDLGPFKLPANDPQYPTDYILDGQQRITSIFGVFQTEITLNEPPLWSKIYYELEARENAQELSFLALEANAIDSERHFPIGCFFDPVTYRKATSRYTSDKMVERIDQIQGRFKEALIPVQTMETEDKTAVAIVFERVNQRGVELDTVQLLSAWTWSGDFDLNQKFEELAEDLAPFGFRDVGANKDLLLRCCAAVLVRRSIRRRAYHAERFESAIILRRGDYRYQRSHRLLAKNLHVESLENLPYENLLVPLTVFFSNPPSTQHRLTNADRKEILRWFWRTSFSRRYNSQPVKSLREDVVEFWQLKEKKIKALPINKQTGLHPVPQTPS